MNVHALLFCTDFIANRLNRLSPEKNLRCIVGCAGAEVEGAGPADCELRRARGEVTSLTGFTEALRN